VTIKAFEVLVGMHVGIAAGICVLVVRLLEDYLILPRVLGDAVGLSPLLVLVSVTSVGILLGRSPSSSPSPSSPCSSRCSTSSCAGRSRRRRKSRPSSSRRGKSRTSRKS
jgi:hypothetical protein